ncbi:hypothetical protein B4100_1553 [Heyndrickxia coagulans]|nr:hypothetical protein B4100_1553 [Heyndrickxia coagulans]
MFLKNWQKFRLYTRSIHIANELEKRKRSEKLLHHITIAFRFFIYVQGVLLIPSKERSN